MHNILLAENRAEKPMKWLGLAKKKAKIVKISALREKHNLKNTIFFLKRSTGRTDLCKYQSYQNNYRHCQKEKTKILHFFKFHVKGPLESTLGMLLML